MPGSAESYSPAISVIVAAFNAEEFLPAAISSVSSQSFPDWELIIVDDGSSDATPSIAADAAARDSRIRNIRTGNRGVSAARNLGISHARGQYVAFLDADDILHPDFLKILLNAAQNNEAEIVVGRFVNFSAAPPSWKPEKRPPRIVSGFEAAALSLYQDHMDNAVWGKLYRREIWNDLRFEPGLRYEDLDVNPRAFSLARRVVLLDVPLYGYRQHLSSYVHTFSLARTDALRVTSRLLLWAQNLSRSTGLPAPPPPQEYENIIRAAADRNMSAAFNILLLLYANKVREPEIEKNCIQIIRRQAPSSLRNPSVRPKNRIGALLFLITGPRLLRLISPVFYHS